MNSFSLTDNFCHVLRHTFCLRGRAARRELWGFFLIPWLVFLGATTVLAGLHYLMKMVDITAHWCIALIFAINVLFVFLLAALFVPFFTLCIRRLHDVGRSGKWMVAWAVLNAPPALMAFSALACGEPFMALAAFVAAPMLLSHLLPDAAVATGSLVLTLLFLIANLLLFFFLLIHFLSSGDEGSNEYGPNPNFSRKQIS